MQTRHKARRVIAAWCSRCPFQDRERQEVVSDDQFRKEACFMGGFTDSVIGIITGAINGIAPQVLAILASLGIPG